MVATGVMSVFLRCVAPPAHGPNAHALRYARVFIEFPDSKAWYDSDFDIM